MRIEKALPRSRANVPNPYRLQLPCRVLQFCSACRVSSKQYAVTRIGSRVAGTGSERPAGRGPDRDRQRPTYVRNVPNRTLLFQASSYVDCGHPVCTHTTTRSGRASSTISYVLIRQIVDRQIALERGGTSIRDGVIQTSTRSRTRPGPCPWRPPPSRWSSPLTPNPNLQRRQMPRGPLHRHSTGTAQDPHPAVGTPPLRMRAALHYVWWLRSSGGTTASAGRAHVLLRREAPAA